MDVHRRSWIIMRDKQEVVREAVLSAGSILKEAFGRFYEGEIEKNKNDFVTEIDIQSERMIIDVLKEAYPEIGIMAEESEPEGAEGVFWIIDPLDGTTNFVHGYPVMGVSVALFSEGEVVLGTVYDPLRGELFEAIKGYGAFLNGRKVSVSPVNDLSDSLLGTGFPFRVHEFMDDYLDVFRSLFLGCRGIRRAGAAVLDLAYVAAGRLDGFFELYLKPWDMAAGGLLVSEAGGEVTDFFGAPGYLNSGNIVAAGGGIHRDIVDVTASAFKREDLKKLETGFVTGR